MLFDPPNLALRRLHFEKSAPVLEDGQLVAILHNSHPVGHCRDAVAQKSLLRQYVNDLVLLIMFQAVTAGRNEQERQAWQSAEQRECMRPRRSRRSQERLAARKQVNPGDS
jgi:hypothetical protein